MDLHIRFAQCQKSVRRCGEIEPLSQDGVTVWFSDLTLRFQSENQTVKRWVYGTLARGLRPGLWLCRP